MENLYLIFGLVVLSGISNSTMDVLKFRYNVSVFSRLPKKIQYFTEPSSWRNKYKDRDPSKGESFWGSTTIFVCCTNLWHLSQMLWRVSMSTCIIIALFINYDAMWHEVLLLFGVLSALYLGAFRIFYEKIYIL